MVMVAGVPIPIPLSVGGVLGLLIDALIAFLIIIIADQIIAHEVEAKNALIMSLVAYFVVPIIVFFSLTFVTALGSITWIFLQYVIPLLVWIVLAELLLKEANMGEKLKIAVLAFAVFAILTFVGVPGMLMGLLPF